MDQFRKTFIHIMNHFFYFDTTQLLYDDDIKFNLIFQLNPYQDIEVNIW